MRRYLLDTGPLAAYLLGRPAAVALIDPWIDRREAATSILVYAEVTEYLKGMTNFALRHAQLRQQLQEIHPYFLTYPILETYAEIRRGMRPPRGLGLIGDIDTLIAAMALERNLTVATVDKDFERIPDLTVMLVRLR